VLTYKTNTTIMTLLSYYMVLIHCRIRQVLYHSWSKILKKLSSLQALKSPWDK